MTILQEMEYNIRKLEKSSVSKYLPEYLNSVKSLTEAQYTEILSVLLTEADNELTAAKKAMDFFKGQVDKFKKVLKKNPKDAAALANLNRVSKGFTKSQLAYMKIAQKFKNLQALAKGAYGKTKESVGKKAAENPIVKKALANKKMTAGVGAGAVAAGGLMKYAASRKRKQAAAKKLGIK